MWAKISRLDRDTHTQPSTQSDEQDHHTSKITKTTQYNAPPPLQFKQRFIPAGDKEYRDTLKQSRYSLPTSSRSSSLARGRESRDSTPKRNLPQNISGYKNTRTRMKSPINTSLSMNPQGQDMKSKCAWCFHHNKMHNHTTTQCGTFQKANKEDKWHVTYRNKTCQNYLQSDQHHWTQCTRPQNLCSLYLQPRTSRNSGLPPRKDDITPSTKPMTNWL